VNDVNPQQLAILIGLILVVVGVGVYQYMNVAGAPARPSSAATAPAGGNTIEDIGQIQDVSQADLDELVLAVSQDIIDYAQERVQRNPMLPVIGGPPTGEGEDEYLPPPPVPYKVTGILYDAYDPMAVVDGNVVTVGYEFQDGSRIYAIERQQIVIQKGDQVFPVRLEELQP